MTVTFLAHEREYDLRSRKHCVLMKQCYTVKSGIDAQLSAGTLGENQTYADAWLSGVSRHAFLTPWQNCNR
jgi:hypothetical protein